MITRILSTLAITALFVSLVTSSVFAQTWAQQAALANDQAFNERVQMALISSAIAISNEAASVPNHTARAVLARQIVMSPGTWAKPFVLGVVADLAMRSTSTDVQISDRIAAIFNTYTAP